MKILEYLSNPRNIIILLSIIIIVLLFSYIKSCENNLLNKQLYKQNFNALNDTLRIEKNKNNELVTVSTAYILELDELKKYNEDLYKEYLKEKNNIKVLTKTEIQIQEVPVLINNEIELKEDGLTYIKWNYLKDTIGFSQKLTGVSTIQIDTTYNTLSIKDLGTKINENLISISLINTIRFNKSNNLYESVVYSPYQNVKFNVETNIDPSMTGLKKENNFIIGPTLGIIGFSGNWSTQQPINNGLSWYIGFGVTYKLISF